jgi:hypothetical protein
VFHLIHARNLPLMVEQDESIAGGAQIQRANVTDHV